MERNSSETHDDSLTGKNFRKIMLVIFSAMIILAAISIVPMMTSGAEREAIIRIPAKATEKNLNDTLSKYFGDSYAEKVVKLMKLRHIDLSSRHGAYLIPEGTSPFRAMRKLGRGAQSPIKLTINGFRGLPLMADRMSRKIDSSSQTLLRQFTDPSALSSYNLTPEQALALFLDDTYEVYWTTTPQELMKKIGDHYDSVWNTERRKKAEALGLTPEEVITIASIVDEETNKKDEKGRVGRLYINRLHKGMRLQADPTVRFALQDFTIKRVKGEHLNVDSPYNTYRVTGLPPGPIRTTSVETIDLILNSTPSEDLYMCAREDFSGYHNFATNYGDHVQNALRYQHALDMKGIN